MYSQGSSEEITGRALKDFANRDEIVIATKLRHAHAVRSQWVRPLAQGDLHRDRSQPPRLGTDYVDLYQIHRRDPTRRWKRHSRRCTTWSRRARSATSGPPQCRHGNSPRRCTLQKGNGWARFVSMQDHYNLLAREEEREMLPLCARRGCRHDPLEPVGPGPADPTAGDRNRPLRDRRLVRGSALFASRKRPRRASRPLVPLLTNEAYHMPRSPWPGWDRSPS